MNTNYLKYFIALYRTGNMHKAAEEMYISQQGLSRIIQSLEKEWGAVFFQRSNQGMKPTKAGDYFYEKAVILENELINAQRDLQAMKEGKQEIRLSLASGSVYKFYPIIEQYRKSNPDLHIRWTEVSERVAKRMLLSREADGALLTENEGNDPIVYHPLFHNEQYLMVYEGHPFYEYDRVNHAMLKDEKLIIETSNRKMINHFNRACAKEGFLPNCIVQSLDTAFCYRLCSRKEGLVVTMNMGYEFQNYPNVKMIPFEEDGYINQVYFARRSQANDDILALEEDLISIINNT